MYWGWENDLLGRERGIWKRVKLSLVLPVGGQQIMPKTKTSRQHHKDEGKYQRNSLKS